MIALGRKKAAVLAIALILAGAAAFPAYSVALTVTAQPLQNTGTGGAITQTADWSATGVISRQHSLDFNLDSGNRVTGVTVKGSKCSSCGAKWPSR